MLMRANGVLQERNLADCSLRLIQMEEAFERLTLGRVLTADEKSLALKHELD